MGSYGGNSTQIILNLTKKMGRISSSDSLMSQNQQVGLMRP